MIKKKITVDVPVTKKKTITYRTEGVKCSLCGKEIDPSKAAFHSKLPAKFFDGWHYQMDIKKMTFKDVRFKNTYYKIIGYTKVQREVVYFIWKLFHRKTIDYWECPRCLKKR